MSSGNWLNTDGLYLEFGTTKPALENWGDYSMPGGNRVVEGVIDLATLPTFGTTGIVSNNVFFPPAGASAGANSNSWFIEKVEIIAETVMSTSSSPTISIGLIQDDRTTVPSNYDHAFVNAAAAATLAQGYVVTITAGGTAVGTLVGTTPAAATGPYYITATLGTANATGSLRVRIYYRGIGVITR